MASEATYRFELAKSGRAGCQNSACKKEGIKIAKGEFRVGSLVTIRDHTTFMWKHWGCVTPVQIARLQEQVGPLDDLDLDEDLPNIIDGYDEIDEESQNKIKYALEHGHVNDEDWKGDPELNRPGMKGINKRTPKKKASEENPDDEAAGEDGETPSKPKQKKSRSKKSKAEPEDEDEMPASPVAKKKAGVKRKAKVDDDDEEEEEEEEDAEIEAPPKKQRSRKRQNPIKDEDDDDEPAQENPMKKPRSKKMKVEKPEAQEMPEAPAAEPVKRERGSKRKNLVQLRAAAAEAKNTKEVEVKPKAAKGSRKGKAIKEEDVAESNTNADVKDEATLNPRAPGYIGAIRHHDVDAAAAPTTGEVTNDDDGDKDMDAEVEEKEEDSEEAPKAKGKAVKRTKARGRKTAKK